MHLVPLRVAELADSVQEHNSHHPLILGEFHLAGKVVDVLDKRAKDSLEARWAFRASRINDALGKGRVKGGRCGRHLVRGVGGSGRVQRGLDTRIEMLSDGSRRKFRGQETTAHLYLSRLVASRQMADAGDESSPTQRLPYPHIPSHDDRTGSYQRQQQGEFSQALRIVWGRLDWGQSDTGRGIAIPGISVADDLAGTRLALRWRIMVLQGRFPRGLSAGMESAYAEALISRTARLAGKVT